MFLKEISDSCIEFLKKRQVLYTTPPICSRCNASMNSQKGICTEKGHPLTQVIFLSVKMDINQPLHRHTEPARYHLDLKWRMQVFFCHTGMRIYHSDTQVRGGTLSGFNNQ